MKTASVYRLICRLVIGAVVAGFFTTTTGKVLFLFLAVLWLCFVSRLLLTLAWWLFVGCLFVLAIIISII